ncbi:MAG: TetR/AcrR family transcriptional regulator [Halodesulfurarchaeum sp.]|nr:TetR/AcrR family transcriptional regulator [Halodesulfurarchaeum sp.]
MTDTFSFLAEPADTRESIMQATYFALCEHGYAGLTIARIAEDFEKSKSLLYHHYDSKDELLLDFLGFMLEEFQRSIPEDGKEPPEKRLEKIIEGSLEPETWDEGLKFTRAMTELRAQAAHDERFRKHFTDHDRVLRETVVETIETGIGQGVFRDVDVEQVAAFLVAALSGGMSQLATTESDLSPPIREELDRYVSVVLRAE